MFDVNVLNDIYKFNGCIKTLEESKVFKINETSVCNYRYVTINNDKINNVIDKFIEDYDVTFRSIKGIPNTTMHSCLALYAYTLYSHMSDKDVYSIKDAIALRSFAEFIVGNVGVALVECSLKSGADYLVTGLATNTMYLKLNVPLVVLLFSGDEYYIEKAAGFIIRAMQYGNKKLEDFTTEKLKNVFIDYLNTCSD